MAGRVGGTCERSWITSSPKRFQPTAWRRVSAFSTASRSSRWRRGPDP